MNKSFYFLLFFLILGIFLGFSNNDNPESISKKFAKTDLTSQKNSGTIHPKQQNPNSNAIVLYLDDFDGANDTVALKARGYLVYRNGTSTGAVSPIWFQGNPNLFPSYNGPPNGYVAANFEAAGLSGNIDNWLVLPRLNLVFNDSICFYARSIDGNIFPDSMRVMYSASGDSVPSAASWVELGRFLVNPDSAAFAADKGYQLKGFGIPSGGTGARVALRYKVIDGGLFGDNSNYIGIDALCIVRDEPLPVELSSFTSVTKKNEVTLNWTTSTETNNSGFDVERSSNGEWVKVGFVNGNGTAGSPNNYTFLDRRLNSGKHNYRLKQIDFNGNFTYYNLSNDVQIGLPDRISLAQNYPNPFNPSTVINYEIPLPGFVKLTIYNINGKEIKSLVNENQDAGYYSLKVNASDLSSGMYFYTLTANNYVETKKMLIVK